MRSLFILMQCMWVFLYGCNWVEINGLNSRKYGKACVEYIFLFFAFDCLQWQCSSSSFITRFRFILWDVDYFKFVHGIQLPVDAFDNHCVICRRGL